MSNVQHILFKDHKHKFFVILAVIMLSFGYALTSSAQGNAAVPSSIQEAIHQNDPGAGGTLARRVRFFDIDSVEKFYAGRAYEPFWLSHKNESEQIKNINDIKSVLEVLEASWTHGLNPEQYHVAQIRNLLQGRDKLGLELYVTDAVMRYGHDITGMRIDPASIKQKAEYWRQPLDGLAIMNKVASASEPAQVLAGFAPDGSLYKALQQELVKLSHESAAYDHLLPMTFGGNNHFTPGSTHKDIAALRARLGVDYDPRQGSESYYDDKTAAALMKFQREHALEPDGIIGPRTLAVLNRTKRGQMEQIIANMERLRWLEQEKPERYLLVNIGQQLLWAVDRGKVVHEMKVVVGMPWRRTKEFKAEVQGVRFNPDWTVPIGIKMSSFLPELKKDPGYLAQKGIEILKGYGSDAVTLDPYAIDWHKVGWKEMGEMRFVQTPGEHNALGAIRILMPNIYNMYLHDTNHPEFFERGQRTYSSGCIRMAEPEKIANFVLGHNKDWSQRKMDAIIATGATTEVMATEGFPVYVIYQTMWIDEKGQLVYGPDVYKRDRELLDVLAAMDGYRLPGARPTTFASVRKDGKTALAYNR